MKYYVNKQANAQGQHDLHSEFCGFLPTTAKRIYLGDFSNCSEAESRATKLLGQINKCLHCCGKSKG